MADNTVELNQNIQMLTEAVKSLNTNMFGSTGGRPGVYGAQGSTKGVNNTSDPHKDALKVQAASTLLSKRLEDNTNMVKFLIKNQSKNIQDLGTYTAVAAKYFQNSLKSFSAEQLNDEIPRQLTEFLGTALKEPLKNYEDVLRLVNRTQLKTINDAEALSNEYQALLASGVSVDIAYNRVAGRANKLGFSLDELGVLAREDGKGFKELREQTEKLAPQLAKFAAGQEAHAAMVTRATRAIEIFAGVAGSAAKIYYQANLTAAKYGTEATWKSIAQAAAAGLTPEELIKVQNENIQAIHSSGISFDSFNKQVDAGAWALLQWTGDLAEGAKLTANTIGVFRTVSRDGRQLESFQQNQFNAFRRLNREVGMTAEQFAGLQTELVNNQDVQTTLLRLSDKERVGYVQGLTLQYEKLRLDGLTNEQAKRVIDKFAEIAGKPILSKLQESFAIQGRLGALGIKGGNELSALLRKINPTAEDEQRKEVLGKYVVQQFAELQKSAAAANDVGRLAAIQNITAEGPLAELLKALQPLATAQGKAQTPEQAAANAKTAAITANEATAVGVVQAVNKGASDVVHAIWEAAAAYAAAKWLPGLGKGLANLIRGGSWVGEAATTAGEGAAVAGAGAGSAALGAGGVLAAGAVGYGLGTLVTDIIPKALGAKEGLGEWIGDKLYDAINGTYDANAGAQTKIDKQTELLQQTNDLLADIKKNGDDHGKKLDALHKLTKQAADLSAAQTAEHIDVTQKATLKIVGMKDTHRPPSRQ